MVKDVNKNKVKKFNCCPKLTSPVIIPTRKEVLEIFDELKPIVVNNFFTVEDLVNAIGVFIGERFHIHVKHAESAQVDQNSIQFNGFYDGGLDEAGDIPIEIYMITNPIQDVILIDNEQFDLIGRELADTLAHEVIHMKQSRSRDFLEVGIIVDKEPESEEEENRYYLSSPDEINAYAYNIANELLERNSLPMVMKKLNNLRAISMQDSMNLWAYVQTFNKDATHPVLKKLIKKVYISLINLSK